MPCTDGGYPYDRHAAPRTYNGLTAEQLEAVLCGLFTVLEDHGLVGGYSIAAWLAAVDWEEAGVTRKQAADWWKAHKAADKARLERETRIREEAELKASALSKLTPAERNALGIK
jgi:hypothetical protein